MYSVCVILIVIASLLVIFAVLVQSPKSGMAANFGVANQVMGVRETTNFLEKFTWGLAVFILLLCLIATATMTGSSSDSAIDVMNDNKKLEERALESMPAMPQADITLPDTATAPEENN